MRILHVTDYYTPRLGGIEAHVHGLAHRQAARGDDVTVVTPTRPDSDGRHADDSGEVEVLRARWVTDAMRQLDEQVASYDVVHAHISTFGLFTSPVAARLARRGLPTLVTVHSMWSTLTVGAVGLRGPWPGAHADIAGLRRAPVAWTAVSREAADQLARQLPRGTMVGVLPNAVEAPPRRQTPSAADRPVRLLSTMRIARRKRPLALLRMFADLAASTSVPLHLTVVGDGPQRDRFAAAARRRGLADRITVTGRVEPNEVLRRLGDADIYVAPAVLESFGLAALEARCVGLPVVGHSASGLSDFIRNGVEGWLSPTDETIVERLRLLVEDDDLRLRISEHNRTTPSELTWTHSIDRHDRAYDIAGSRSLSGRPGLLAWGAR